MNESVYDKMLINACRHYNYDNALTALNNGANPDTRDPMDIFERPALIHAIESESFHQKSFEISKLLIERGADVNESGYEVCPLMMAVEWKTPSLVQYLLNAGADVNKSTLSHALAINSPCRDLIVELLLDAGSIIDYQNISELKMFRLEGILAKRSARRKSAFMTSLYLRKILGRDCANYISFLVWMDRD